MQHSVSASAHARKIVHNFYAGPSALPRPVLEQVEHELFDFEGTGISILEMSHRGTVYEKVHFEAQANLRQLLGCAQNDDYGVLLMGGGARTQFAVLAMNLLRPHHHAAYVTTGIWSEGALAEGRKIGDVREIWSSASTRHDHVPQPDEPALHTIDPHADYLHITSNNTVFGTQYHRFPTPPSGVPMVCDMSSDILSRPIPVTDFGMIYAGAQKNMGAAGVTVVVIRRDLVERSSAHLPEMLSYKKILEAQSLLNTPPVFAIYILNLVTRWVISQGGVTAMAERNGRKAKLLYDVIDQSGGFYVPAAQRSSRSLMNVTFRLPDAALEKQLIAQSLDAGFLGLKGHKAAGGGLRASLYNAVPMASVEALCAFLKDFSQRHG